LGNILHPGDPCALIESGGKKTLAISAAEIVIAIAIGGIAFRGAEPGDVRPGREKQAPRRNKKN
jgi:hypothetical protein